MILQPLCVSDYLGEAISFAEEQYTTLSKGARPFIHTLPFVKGDTFLIRVCITLAPESDLVQILLASARAEFTGGGGVVAGGSARVGARHMIPQEITFDNYWVEPGIPDPEIADHDTPMYASGTGELTHPHRVYPGIKIGQVDAVGGASGKPVVLTSDNLDVCTTLGNIIISQGPGKVRFTLNQDGGGSFLAAPELRSGTHIFAANVLVTGSDGVVVGGAARINQAASYVGTGGVLVGGHSKNNAFNEMHGSGGVVVGGSAHVVRHNSYVGTGGVVVGGTRRVAVTKTFVAKGGAVVGGTALVAKKTALVGHGGAVVGGKALISRALQARAKGGVVVGGSAHVVKQANFQPAGGVVVGGKALVHHTAPCVGKGGVVVGGSASMSREAAARGRGGAVVGGAAAVSNSKIPQPKLYVYPRAIPYASRRNFAIGASVGPKRGGTTMIEVVGVADATKLQYLGLTVGLNLNEWALHFDALGTWIGTTTFSCRAKEITLNDGVETYSDPQTVSIEILALQPLSYTINDAPYGNNFTILGGLGPYRLSFYHGTSAYSRNVTFELYSGSYGRVFKITEANEWWSNGEYIVVTDALGSKVYIPLTSLTVPLYGAILNISVTPPNLKIGQVASIQYVKDPNGGAISFTVTPTSVANFSGVVGYNGVWNLMGLNTGTYSVTMTQQGANGYPTKSVTASAQVGGATNTWTTVWFGCGWYNSTYWTTYMTGPDTVVYSPDGKYRLTWRIIKPEYRGLAEYRNAGHAPTDFADLIFGTATESDVNWTYNTYFYPYNIFVDPAVDNYIHCAKWEHLG